MNIRILFVAFLCVLPLTGRAQTAADPVDDAQLENTLRTTTEKLMQAGKTVDAGTLRAQLKRTGCELRLPALSAKSLSPPQAYTTCRDSVAIVGALYKCDKCAHWHVSTATAFAIAEPDVFVTNYHVFKNTNELAFVAMNRQQNVQPVQEILAASPSDDIAIIRIPGMRMRPLALRADASVGSPVTLISHTDQHFYFFTQGAIARYSDRKRKDRSTLTMEITADFCKGSSGAPILDERGNAVGMVSSTQTVVYEKERPDSVQMVFKDCVPVASILKLVKSR